MLFLDFQSVYFDWLPSVFDHLNIRIFLQNNKDPNPLLSKADLMVYHLNMLKVIMEILEYSA